MKFAAAMFPTAYSIRPAALARAIEERGFDALFFPDHSHIPLSRRNPTPHGDRDLPTVYAEGFDPFIALTMAALVTSRIKLGTAISLLVNRDAIQTAKEIASLDVLSGGRVLLGVGAGWIVEEIEDHGTPFERRFKVLRERIDAMKVLWTEDEPEYHGEFVNFGRCRQEPKPVQKPHPPVYLGSSGPRALQRVVRYADGWMPSYARVQQLRAPFEELQRLARENGRGPIPVTVANVPAEPAVLGELAEIGVERCSLWFPSASEAEIMPFLDKIAKLIEQF